MQRPEMLKKIPNGLGKIPGFRTVYRFISGVIANNIVGIAAQIAFFLLLSLFPLILTVVSVLARLNIEMHPELFDGIIPLQVVEVINAVIENGKVSATFTIVTIALSLWSASAGVWAMMRGICLSYTHRLPNWLRGRASAILVTLLFLAVLVMTLALWVFGETLIEWIQRWVQFSDGLITLLRYVLTISLLFLFILLVYRASPGYNLKSWQNMPGALFASICWALVSRLYEMYITVVKDYAALYGGVGAFIGLAVWLLLISMLVLLGAELNASLEDTRRCHQQKDRERKA